MSRHECGFCSDIQARGLVRDLTTALEKRNEELTITRKHLLDVVSWLEKGHWDDPTTGQIGMAIRRARKFLGGKPARIRNEKADRIA